METEFIMVKPAEGFTILDPNTFLRISADGTRVRKSAYWDRLEAEGAIVVVPEVKPEPEIVPDDEPKNKPARAHEGKK